MKNILTYCILFLFKFKSFAFNIDTSRSILRKKKFAILISTGIYNNYNHQNKKYLSNPGFTFTSNIGALFSINKHFQIGLSLVYNYALFSSNSGVYSDYWYAPNSSDTILNQNKQYRIETKSHKLGLSFNFRYNIKKFYFDLGLNYMPYDKNYTKTQYNNYTFNIIWNQTYPTKWSRLYYDNYQYKFSIGYKINQKLNTEASYIIAVPSPATEYFYNYKNPFWSTHFQHFGLIFSYLL